MQKDKTKEIIDELSKNLIRDGIIKTKGKTDEQIRLEIKNYLWKDTTTILDFELSLDFTKGLLFNAKYFLNNSDYHSAIVFYALWLEHWFNNIILISLKRKNINLTYYQDIIRSTNLKNKTTWLWQLLQLRPLNNSHLKVIEKVFEKRNSFIHYKWKAYNNHEIKGMINELEDFNKFALTIDKTISYLKKYENKNIYYNKKKISKNVILPPV